MIGVLIVTHGRLAHEFRAALEHVVGPQEQLETISIGPDDDLIAFTATAAVIGTAGPQRLGAPMSLMVKRKSSAELTELAKGLRDPFGLRFSPTGRCIGFGAELDEQGEGTFVVDPDHAEVHKISDTAIGAAWSPNEKYLAGAVREGLGAESRLWLVVLPASCP